MTFGFGNQHSIQLSYGRTQVEFYAQRIGASIAWPTTQDATAASNFVVRCTHVIMRALYCGSARRIPNRAAAFDDVVQLSGTAR